MTLKEQYDKVVCLRGKAEETYRHAKQNYEESYKIYNDALDNLVAVAKLEGELKDKLDKT